MKWSRAALLVSALSAVVLTSASRVRAADPKKPNILVIFGDDIGITNLSCYSGGLMGSETPNIDRLAREGHHSECSRAPGLLKSVRASSFHSTFPLFSRGSARGSFDWSGPYLARDASSGGKVSRTRSSGLRARSRIARLFG